MIATGRQLIVNGVAKVNARRIGVEMRKSKICMFVDNTNFFHAQRLVKLEDGMDTKRLDYMLLKDVLHADEVRFYYSIDDGYVPTSEDSWQKKQGRDKFYHFLHKHAGFKMVKLPLRQRTDPDAGTTSILHFLNEKGYTDDEILRITHQKPSWLKKVRGGHMPEEKGLDCEIVYDMSMLARTGDFDTFVLVAGDEDYARSVSRIPKETGVEVKVAFFGDLCSNFLRESASGFIDLREYPDLFKTPINRQFAHTV